MKMNEDIVITVECSSCKGTGLYKGFSEKGRCAVVCHTCDGTGKVTKYFKKFTGRKERQDIDRVFAGSYGYMHHDKDYTDSYGTTIKFSEGGCKYKRWLAGQKPLPVKDLYCPYIWDNQGIGNEPLIKCHSNQKRGLGTIAECTLYYQKEQCWQEFENNIGINPNYDKTRKEV